MLRDGCWSSENVVMEGVPGLTNGEHDSVRQLHVADADPRDEADETRYHVRVVNIDGLCDGLEAIEQGFCVLGKEGATGLT